MSTHDLRKAAVLLMSLPPEQAAGLLGKLDPRQMEAVSIEIAKLQPRDVPANHPGFCHPCISVLKPSLDPRGSLTSS